MPCYDVNEAQHCAECPTPGLNGFLCIPAAAGECYKLRHRSSEPAKHKLSLPRAALSYSTFL